MVSTWRAAFILSGMLFCSQVLLSSAITEEDRLREAISNSGVESFELKSNIKLTKELPPLKLLSGQTRVLRIFSRGGFSLSGAKKFRGISTPKGLAPSLSYPVATLTIENVKLINFAIKISRQQPTTVGPTSGGAVGVEKTLLTITNCTVSGVLDSSIYVGGGTLVVKNSKFSKTNAVRGGAISFVKGIALTIGDSEFTNNIAASNGGAVYVESSALITVARSTFKANRAGNGGAFGVFFDRNVVPSTPPLLDSCTFDSNYAFFGIGDEAVAGAIVLSNVKEIRFVKPIFKNNYVPPLTDGLVSGAPNNILVVTAPGDKTTIRVLSGVISFIKGTSPNNFVVLSS